MKRIMTCGTFDVFHHGHLNMLRNAKKHGDYLIVGVSSDELNRSKKERSPIYPIEQRLDIIGALKCVDEVFIEESLDQKLDYIKKFNIDLFIIGDDWEGKFDFLKESCDVLYLKRTPSISTTEIIDVVRTGDTLTRIT